MKSRELDQFYTNTDIAQRCWIRLAAYLRRSKLRNSRTGFLEPSAGTGAFVDVVDGKVVAVDIDPRHPKVEYADFLKDDLSRKLRGRRFIVLGNPPFGKNASLAIRFFNRAAGYDEVEVIAFIVPRTFRKVSVQDKLDLSFTLVQDFDVPADAFVFNGEAYDVPCCFQIWARRKKQRVKSRSVSNPFFEYVDQSQAEIAVRRVGGTAGTACRGPQTIRSLKPQCFYFLRRKRKDRSIRDCVDLINSVDFLETVSNTAGPKSLSKGEFNLAMCSLERGEARRCVRLVRSPIS